LVTNRTGVAPAIGPWIAKREEDLRTNPSDLDESYQKFLWTAVEPFSSDGLRYLMTTEGKGWIASLCGKVFVAEHRELTFGPQLTN